MQGSAGGPEHSRVLEEDAIGIASTGGRDRVRSDATLDRPISISTRECVTSGLRRVFRAQSIANLDLVSGRSFPDSPVTTSALRP